jgi:hypothetical protein
MISDKSTTDEIRGRQTIGSLPDESITDRSYFPTHRPLVSLPMTGTPGHGGRRKGVGSTGQQEAPWRA